MKPGCALLRSSSSILAFILCFSILSLAQKHGATRSAAPGPMLNEGIADYDTSDFTLCLVRSSQTIAALKPKGGDGFDFTPGDLLSERSQNGYFHLGDITLRFRSGDSANWTNYSTATVRAPVQPLPASAHALSRADLAATLAADIPLQITRTGLLEDGKLVLRFVLKNKSSQPVQIGALGIPMIFNNVLNDRSLEQAHATLRLLRSLHWRRRRLPASDAPQRTRPRAAGGPRWPNSVRSLQSDSGQSGQGGARTDNFHRSHSSRRHLRRFLRLDGSQRGLREE